jgi:hypothetical protein
LQRLFCQYGTVRWIRDEHQHEQWRQGCRWVEAGGQWRHQHRQGQLGAERHPQHATGAAAGHRYDPTNLFRMHQNIMPVV